MSFLRTGLTARYRNGRHRVVGVGRIWAEFHAAIRTLCAIPSMDLIHGYFVRPRRKDLPRRPTLGATAIFHGVLRG